MNADAAGVHPAPEPDPARTCSCASPSASQLDRRGLTWILGAFILCPCHLPITLWLLSAVLSGSIAGSLVAKHSWVVGSAITGLWVLLTGYGARQLQLARRARARQRVAAARGAKPPSPWEGYR